MAAATANRCATRRWFVINPSHKPGNMLSGRWGTVIFIPSKVLQKLVLFVEFLGFFSSYLLVWHDIAVSKL